MASEGSSTQGYAVAPTGTRSKLLRNKRNLKFLFHIDAEPPSQDHEQDLKPGARGAQCSLKVQFRAPLCAG
ncbi:hypothetical protein GN956_G16396 [Arapaima gigas]